MQLDVGDQRRQLAHRVTGGLEVTLYWSADDNTTHIEVVQRATHESLAFAVAGDQALDAFYHPFAHVLVGAP